MNRSQSRSAIRWLAPTLGMLALSSLLGPAALAGGPPEPYLDFFLACEDPSEAGLSVSIEFSSRSEAPDACAKDCKDIAKACLGAGKANYGCINKLLKPVVKVADRRCAEDIDEDGCLEDLYEEVEGVKALLKMEKDQVKESCVGLLLGCLEMCGGL